MCFNPLRLAKDGELYYGVLYPKGLNAQCGKCAQCKIQRRQQWIFRMSEEQKQSQSCHFVTLTYNNEHVPRTKNGFNTLNRKSLKSFWKKLRRKNQALGNKNKIKYYIAGEYGGLKGRPHYHAIIYNSLEETYTQAWTNKNGQQLGTVDIGTVTEKSIAYTTSYIDKYGKIPQHSRDDREPEFSNKSNGLGLTYINEITKIYHQRSRDMTIRIGKVKVPIPRYYKSKIWSEKEVKILGEINSTKRQKNEEYKERVFNTNPERNEDYLTHKRSLQIQMEKNIKRRERRKIAKNKIK